MAGGTVKQIGKTKSICPECLKVISADKVQRNDGIYLEKECPDHGQSSVLIWEGSLESYEAWGGFCQKTIPYPGAGKKRTDALMTAVCAAPIRERAAVSFWK